MDGGLAIISATLIDTYLSLGADPHFVSEAGETLLYRALLRNRFSATQSPSARFSSAAINKVLPDFGSLSTSSGYSISLSAAVVRLRKSARYKSVSNF